MKGRMKLKTRYKVLLIAAAVVIVLVSAAAHVTFSKTRAMMDFRTEVLMYTPWRHVIERTTFSFPIPWWTPRGLNVKNRPLSEKSRENRWAMTATFYDLENTDRLYKNLDWLFSHMEGIMGGMYGKYIKPQVKAAIDTYLRNPGATGDTTIPWYNTNIRVSRVEGNIVVAFSWAFGD